jgi:hypothetical protein
MTRKLVEDFFKRDLSDAELDALAGRLQDEGEALRFSAEAARFHQGLGAAAGAALALKASQIGASGTWAGQLAALGKSFKALLAKSLLVKTAVVAVAAASAGGALMVYHAVQQAAPAAGTVPASIPAPPSPVPRPAAKPWGRQLALKLRLEEAAEVESLVLNAQGSPVRALGLHRWDAGVHRLVWDGSDDQGNPVQAGRYRIVIRWNGKETGQWVELRQRAH